MTTEVDLLGFFRGGLGLGKQVRSLYEVLQASDISASAYDISDKNQTFNMISSQDILSNRLTSPTRIISTTLPHIGVLLSSGSQDLFDCERLIFHLAWEFDSYPTQLAGLSQIADSCWSISSFAAKGLHQYGSNYTKVMSNFVPPKSPKPNIYSGDTLQKRPFTFFFAFDFCSTFTRKNPLAVIQAFRQAFSSLDGENVRLIIKAHSSKHHPNDAKKLRDHASVDPRVQIIDRFLEEDEYKLLWSEVDCVVSLHRSEGFGLLVAEAISMNIPVITTGYSGNMDFCSESNSYLVDYELVPVSSGEYPYSEFSCWAEPDVTMASEYMRTIFAKSRLSNHQLPSAPSLPSLSEQASLVSSLIRSIK